ncbi:hypothetical protein SCYAM73S_04251 [Streptomyces cyaneofuscatus]
MRPASPTMSRQPWATAASTLTLALTSGGRTSSWYAYGWSANHSRQGSETTRASWPSAASNSRASRAMWTSDPVPMRMTSGVSLRLSART